jgi:hypothetical protein
MFAGLVHSSEYREPSPCRRRHVLVVGDGNSATAEVVLLVIFTLPVDLTTYQAVVLLLLPVQMGRLIGGGAPWSRESRSFATRVRARMPSTASRRSPPSWCSSPSAS